MPSTAGNEKEGGGRGWHGHTSIRDLIQPTSLIISNTLGGYAPHDGAYEIIDLGLTIHFEVDGVLDCHRRIYRYLKNMVCPIYKYLKNMGFQFWTYSD